MTVTSSPTCDARAVADVLRTDASMAGHVLRLANSAAYRPRAAIVSLNQAIARLGLDQLRQMALVIACQTRVFQVRGYEREVAGAFRHALAAALYAQELARARRWNVEEAFFCGLFHDVGEPVLLQAAVDLQRSLGVVASHDAVLAAVDALHAPVGNALAVAWKLPPRVAESVLFHHDPAAAPTFAPVARMTSLADDLATFALAGDDVAVGLAARAKSHEALVPLDVYPDEIDALLAMRARVRESVESLA